MALAGDPPAVRSLPKEPPRTKEFQERVNRAIDRGAAWLRTRQEPDGGFLRGDLKRWGSGPTALAVLTLRVCGAPADDPAILRGLAALRTAYGADSHSFGNYTYGVALTLLALEALHDPGVDGTRKVSDEDRAWIRSLVRTLIDAQASSGGFGYRARSGISNRVGPSGERDYWDNSNSQFAVLGLGAGRLLGESAPEKVWLSSLRHWLRTQAKDGPKVPWFQDAGVGEAGYGGVSLRQAGVARARGWYYREDHKLYMGSMTTGGVSSIALCRDALRGTGTFDRALDRESLASLRDGLAWLGRGFSVEGNPLGSGSGRGSAFPLFQYYYLYGLERAAVLAGTAWVGKHDWYLEGAEYLVKAQRDDGSWEENTVLPGGGGWEGLEGMPQVDTCFALLFLRRATSRLRTPTKETRAVATTDDVDPARAASLDDASFRDLFEHVFRKFAAAEPGERQARSADFVRMGTRALPLLVLRLESERAEDRSAAIDALRMTTGESRGFDAAAPEESRSAAVRAWEEWWFAKGRKLVPDVEAGRFREP